MGRFDYALMRCCDVDAGNEVATNLVLLPDELQRHGARRDRPDLW